jgi:hypothetical protein
MFDENSPGPPKALPPDNKSILTKLTVTIGLITALLGAIILLLSQIPPFIDAVEKTNEVFKKIHIGERRVEAPLAAENNPGPRPNENCHLVFSMDYTTFPAKTTNTWECK